MSTRKTGWKDYNWARDARKEPIVGDQMVRVTGKVAQQAVRDLVVRGEVYSDGEVWAEVASLMDFYRLRPDADKEEMTSEWAPA